jgi:beta-mannosidase
MKYFLLCCYSLFLIPLTAQVQRTLLHDNWKFKNGSEPQVYPATVPGTIHTDLWTNQLIPDPFFAENEKRVAWVDTCTWEYSLALEFTQAQLDYSNLELVFEGLDTYAEVYLNGQLLFEADNMFRTWCIPVKGLLLVGDNTLQVFFRPASAKGKALAKQLPYTLPGDEKVFTRKAQYHYGWDWGPRFVTAGIFRSVSLEAWSGAKIVSTRHQIDKLDDKQANITWFLSIEVEQTAEYYLAISQGTSRENKRFKLKSGRNTIPVTFTIANPKRWWCNGLGEPHLYDFNFQLLRDDMLLHQTKERIGLRTIELVQEADAKGKSFYFKLNGVPVFMKGANYIPAHSFVSAVTDSTYNAITQAAVDANMNMLRVWGGGIYEQDAFYRHCDEKGLLVWQDFMFACAMYPGDEAYLANVQQEVIDNVTRLQNHACIAIWCGNNESDEGWHNWGWQKQYNYTQAQETKIWADYQALFHRLIPQTLDSLMPGAIYWPSSPSIGWGRAESLLQGDSHYWGVWWGMQPFEIYRQKVGRFMSEYGFQGMPALATFKSFAQDSMLYLQSAAVKNHQKHPTGYETIKTYLERAYWLPQDFEDYIYISQLLQRDGIKIALEAHRQAKPYCMGTLYWQLNDCWPVTSWSSIDFYGRWKALHYQVRESFAPLMLSFKPGATGVELYIVNDKLEAYNADVQCQVLDFSGKVLYSNTLKLDMSANDKAQAIALPQTMFKKVVQPNTMLQVKAYVGQDTLQANYYFNQPKDLKLEKPTINYKLLDNNTLQLTSNTLAKDVYLELEGVFFEQNFVDVLPSQPVLVKLKTSKVVDLQQIKVKSLYDAQ